MRVIAITSTNSDKHLTWRLRVELLLPFLREQRIEVDECRLPRNRADRREVLAARGGYDLVWLHRQICWPRDLRRIASLARAVVLDIDDPIGMSSSRPANFSARKWLKFYTTVRRCAAVMAASDGLVRIARAYNSSVYHVPLCADPAVHTLQTATRLPGEPFRLLWLGGRSTFKYLAAVRPHLEEIGRVVSDVELVVVGHSSLDVHGLRIRNEQWSPAVEAAELRRCHLGLAPIWSDRWTRAKATLKPLQYLANGIPFLGQPVGVNVELAAGGGNGWLADTPQQWAAVVCQATTDEQLRLAMGRRGVEFILRRHAPNVLAAQVGAIFQEVVAQAIGTSRAKPRGGSWLDRVRAQLSAPPHRP